MTTVVPGVLFAVSLLAGLAAATTGRAGEPARPPETSTAPQGVEALIDRAEAARMAAAERGAEWLETQSLIEEARREADLGNWQQAADLAEQALQQGRLAVEQAERESGAWQDRVVR